MQTPTSVSGNGNKSGGNGKSKGGRVGGGNVRLSVSTGQNKGVTGADSDRQERVPVKRIFVVSASTDHRVALADLMSGGLVGVFHNAKNSDDVSHMWDLEEPATWKANAKKKKSQGGQSANG